MQECPPHVEASIQCVGSNASEKNFTESVSNQMSLEVSCRLIRTSQKEMLK